MQKRELSYAHRAMILCVDTYEKGVLQGRLYHPGNHGCCSFQSLSQFLWMTEQTLNTLSFPQSFTALRSFSDTDPPPAPRFSQPQILEGALATFSVRILFRQNASWQGSVRWLEEGREQSFRSALELIFLIDSVLCGKEDREVV